MFSVALHHGGAIVKDCYVGGKLTYFDECMVGRFELLDFSSMLLKLGYERSFICEFYYCDPEYNQECKGTTVGHRVRPIVDECRMDEFLSLAATKGRLMHVYVVEITAALARAKLTEDLKKIHDSLNKTQSSNVVIEEIEDPEPSVPKINPRKKTKLNRKPLLIGWHDRDIEFEEYLQTSLAEAREQWKKHDAEISTSEARKNLMADFDAEDASTTGREIEDNVGLHIHVDAAKKVTNEKVNTQQSVQIEGVDLHVQTQTTNECAVDDSIVIPITVSEIVDDHVEADKGRVETIERASVEPTQAPNSTVESPPVLPETEGLGVDHVEADKGREETLQGARVKPTQAPKSTVEDAPVLPESEDFDDQGLDVDDRIEVHSNGRRSDKGKEKVIDDNGYRPSLERLYEDEDVDLGVDFEDFLCGTFFEETFIPEHQGQPQVVDENAQNVADEVQVVQENVQNVVDEAQVVKENMHNVDTECPLHNEGGDDDDEEVEHFISLAKEHAKMTHEFPLLRQDNHPNRQVPRGLLISTILQHRIRHGQERRTLLFQVQSRNLIREAQPSNAVVGEPKIDSCFDMIYILFWLLAFVMFCNILCV
ncbi:hypothetical protein AAHA92_05387 [Salvia divinorum]|uniref:PB1-like domain-containing protein n=1 Tax=Salvia divinorum TaxID=28513 RepID=A0ABD1I372_SALDI